MRCLILYAALIGAVAGYRTSSTIKPYSSETTFKSEATTIIPESSAATKSTQKSSSTTPAPTSSTSSPTSSSTASSSTSETNLIEGIVSELPITLPPILPHRHMVTYDQRQEGQYNIRADLDNFMIILVPPSPTQGLGLLDLLTKSSLRRTSHTTSHKSKKKHYAATSSLKPDALKHLNYFQTHLQQYGSGSSRGGEYIDGRTPYHVDISSLNEEEVQPRLNPDRQVDVLPPPYPLAYQHHLMKPYHLEAESSLLPPSEMGLQSNPDSAPSAHNAGYYRFARYIRGDNYLDSNRLSSSNRLVPQPFDLKIPQRLPVFRPEMSMGADKLYPPLDVPQFNLQEGRSASPTDDIDVVIPADLPLENDVDLSFIDDDLLEDKAKSLLSDGIERCAPGKRRDSYGVCREIEGY
ncbi:uncharacterized protein ACRADG_005797 [Cochliomyia hominivorax]